MALRLIKNQKYYSFHKSILIHLKSYSCGKWKIMVNAFWWISPFYRLELDQLLDHIQYVCEKIMSIGNGDADEKNRVFNSENNGNKVQYQNNWIIDSF